MAFQPKRRGFRSRSGGRLEGDGARKRKQSQSGDEPDSKQAKSDSDADDSDNGTFTLPPYSVLYLSINP